MDMPIKHVWFDFAGTLFKETPEYKMLHDELRYKTYANVTGIDDLEAAKRGFLSAYQQTGSNTGVFRALGKPADFWSKALDDMDFASVLRPDGEVIRALARIKEIMPISLFTNFIRSRVVELLGCLQIPPADFTTILTGDQLSERKPAPAGFRMIIKESGVPPSQILYVGDRVAVDITPAKNAGMKTCLVYDESAEADYCVQNFGEILNIFIDR
jgi:FMN phosphatase YigB (HAD superfamily)